MKAKRTFFNRLRTLRHGIGLWPLLVALAGLILLVGCEKSGPRHSAASAELPSVGVQLQRVDSKMRPVLEEVVGTIHARLQATLEAKVSGRIQELPVSLGQSIKRGDLVARLDAPEVKARLDQAEAAMEQAAREWKRISGLFGQQAVTRSEFDAAEARYRVAQAAVAEAKAMLAYVEILAPFDGVVTRKWTDIGDLATPGKPLIDMEDPGALRLEADLPETMAALVHREARLQVRLDAMPGELTGSVSEMAPSADPLSRTRRVKLDLPATPGLMSGQFARLMVPLSETASLRVPASAVVQRGQMELVFVVTNDHAQLHLIKTGRRIGDEVEVLSGLDKGDSVVVDIASQLVDGQPVQSK